MIPIEKIKAAYASMSDDALLALYADNHGLIPEAMQALRELLASRGLLQKEEPTETAVVESPVLQEVYVDALKKQVYKWRKEGQDDSLITVRLLHEQLTEAQITFLLEDLHANIRDKVLETEANRLGAFIRLCCGVAIFIIAFLAQLSRGIYFIGMMLVAVSIVQAAIADSKRSRLKAMLETPPKPEIP